ncbi:MAG TPA: hypothetical protein VNW51_00270, partial [Mucilaginibacter sp.]|nr:hypothetical protein [Mucilaginibacter sp.]
RALLTPVVLKNKKQTLADYYIDFSDLRKNWQNRPEVRNIHFLPGENASKFTLHQDSVLSLLYKSLIKNNLNVDKEDKKLNIITVTVNSTDELFSKEFAEVLTKEVSDFYIQTKTEKSSKNVAVLQRQTDSVRQMLNGAITGVATSLDVNPNPNPLLATLRVPSQHRQIDVQANSAILTQLVTNLEIAKMSLLQATPLIQVIDRPILPLEKQNVKKTIGIALGGILVAFLTACFLLMKKIFSDALK